MFIVPATFHRLTPWYCHFFDRIEMRFFSRTTRVHRGCFDATYLLWYKISVPVSKILRSLANWTRVVLDGERTDSFSRVCNSHCRIATKGARCLRKSIAGCHSALLRWFACRNSRLGCCQRSVHCILMRLLSYFLLWHTRMCLIWYESILIHSYKL